MEEIKQEDVQVAKEMLKNISDSLAATLAAETLAHGAESDVIHGVLVTIKTVIAGLTPTNGFLGDLFEVEVHSKALDMLNFMKEEGYSVAEH